MAIASGIGAQLLAAPSSTVPHAFWFGEDQARYIVTVPAADAGLVLAKMKGAGVPCARIGTTGGDAIAVAGEAPVAIEALTSVRELVSELHEREGLKSFRGDAKHRTRNLRSGSGPSDRRNDGEITAPASHPESAAAPASAPS